MLLTDPLTDGEFALAGVILGRAGRDYVVLSDGVDFGSAEVRAQDADRPGRDGTWFGRDYLAGPTWSFSLLVQPGDGDVSAAIARLQAVWHNADVRQQPTRTVPLLFRREGQTCTVWGRPRKFAEHAGKMETTQRGYSIVDCDFKIDSPLVGLGSEHVETLALLRPVSDGGLILPADVPFVLSPGSETSQARDGVIVVAGSVPAPFVLEVKGPLSGSVSGVVVSGDGWRVELTRPLAWDETFRLDTRTMLATVNGTSRPGALSASTRLTGRLRPGRQAFTFNGNDDTGSATATLRWYDTITL